MFAVAVGSHKFNIGYEFFKKRPGLRLVDLGNREKMTHLNIGPPGTTAVYSGKTWHSATTNCSQVMRKGLNMTAGADLLLLCAWAYAQRGEHDEARFAWRQAKEREGSQRLEVAMPKLSEWMQQYREQQPGIDDAEPDEE